MSESSPLKLAFIDVGGNLGQSVAVAVSDLFRFSKVISFEPDPLCVAAIESMFSAEIRSGRLTVIRAALGFADGMAVLSGSNDAGGATTLQPTVENAASGLTCKKVDAAQVVKDLIGQGYAVFIKLNCEGAEVEILDRLCDAGCTEGIVSIMADFDIVKYRGGYFEKRRVLKRCRAMKLPVLLSENVMVGKSHQDRLRNWLAHYPLAQSSTNTDVPKQQRFSRKLKYFMRDIRSTVGLQKNKDVTVPAKPSGSCISTKYQ